VTVQRMTGVPPVVSLSASCKASIKGYSPDQLVGPIQQTDRELRIGARELDRQGIEPRQGDRVVIDDRYMRVEDARPEYWFGAVAFYVLRCRG
jgi:hypothetical protein